MTINGANFTVTATTLCNDGSVQKYFTGGAPSGWSLGALLAQTMPAGAVSMRVDETNYQINPGATELYEQYLWGQYPGGEIIDTEHEDNGTLSFNTNDYVDFPQSLQISMQQSPNGDNGAPYLQFYPYSASSNRWLFLREALDEAHGITWEFNKYNRLRFNIKPVGNVITPRTNGTENLTVGTYYSSVAAGGPTSSNAEVGGNHYYHRFNLRPGVWNQCVMDQHPDHIRGANGATEHGNKEYPVVADEPTYNYYDLMTRIYWDVEETATTAAAPDYLFDQFYFYEETNTEEEQAIYSLSGSYDSGSNTLTLDWRRDKDANSTNFDVRYAFSDIHALGWDNATAAPSGSNIAPAGYGGYNGAYYITTSIDVSGQSEIYFAIRTVGGSLFKQIRLDLEL